MLKLDNILIIGSSGANSGKTRLACDIIERFRSRAKVVAVKVTTVTSRTAPCPRGGTGCGACASLNGDFSLAEESKEDSAKDTARLLGAGASRVFWLRAMKDRLGDAFSALLEAVGRRSVMLCESNSLRRVVEPGLFVLVSNCDHTGWKDSAREVIADADEIVGGGGTAGPFELERLELGCGKWLWRSRATAIVLAGGDSRRLGRDKSMLPVRSQPMIKYICDRLKPYFDEVVISAKESGRYDFLGLRVVGDELPGRGPLGGIVSALEASKSEVNFVIACDIPQFDIFVVRRMLRQVRHFDAVVPQSRTRRNEPVFAVYKKSVLPILKRALTAGRCRITAALQGCWVAQPVLQDCEQPININTVDDYRAFIKGLKDGDV